MDIWRGCALGRSVEVMSTALLLAETEPSARSFLARHLSRDGFEVVTELDEGRRVDLALLPDVSECRRLRERAGDVPVIVVARPGTDTIDKVRALRDGADDVVTIPFSYEELLWRIRAVLRRSAPQPGGVVAVDGLRIDPVTRRVTVAGRPVELPAKEYELLLRLAEEPSRVFTKLELLRDVWGFRSATVRTRTLDSHACRLRRKLQPGEFVVNVWGVGYKLVEAEAEAVCLSGA
jgi:DNA-binding response OmpR family regulator